MKCPKCETPGVYYGFSAIECVNPKCAYYVESYYLESQKKEAVKEVPITDVEANEEEENMPLWLWSNHHHDFGD